MYGQRKMQTPFWRRLHPWKKNANSQPMEMAESEPWSPGFEAAPAECEDTMAASLTCLKDGEFKNMDFQNVIEAMMQHGVTFDEFDIFAGEYGINEDLFIQNVLHHLLAQEKMASPSTPDVWTEEDADAFLEALQSPEKTTNSEPMEIAEFEPSSPGFEAAAAECEDMATAFLTGLNDGEFKVGKTFYCSRCRAEFSNYDTYAKHRDTNCPSAFLESVAAGPSGLQETHETVTTNQEAPKSMEQAGDVQVSCGDEPYKIELTRIRKFARSVATETTYNGKFNDQWQGRQLIDLRRKLHPLFDEVLERARECVSDNDSLRVVIRHASLNYAVVIPLQAADQMNADKIMQKLENVLQSEKTLAIDKSFQVSVIVGPLHIPQGAGRERITKLSGPDNVSHKKSSMVEIVNSDQLCMARAIGVCLAKQCVVSDNTWKKLKDELRELTNPEILAQERKISTLGYKNIKNKIRQEQKHLAILLCQKVGVSTDRPGSLNDIPAFEEALHIRIAVVAASLGYKFVRVPDNGHEDWPLLYLYLVDHKGVNHFHSIVNITGFFSSRYFCQRCFKQYNTKIKHICETTCLTCKRGQCPETETTMSCRSCHMVCRSLDCFERHLEKETRKNGDSGEVQLSQ